MLRYVTIPYLKTERGVELNNYQLSYEVGGCPIGTAPIVLVNHALTGNSSVSGKGGWWSSLIDEGKPIDTSKYSILAFNIPGNAYDGKDCQLALDFTVRDVAQLFLSALAVLKIEQVDTIIGASMGGALSLQIAYLSPSLAKRVVCIASDYKASDWLIAQTLVQQRILQNSSSPLEDARIHAMLCYRTPVSINERFQNKHTDDKTKYQVADWLEYHGRTLANRFSLNAYKVMTNLTATIGVCEEAEELSAIEGGVHFVCIETDLLFPYDRAVDLYDKLKRVHSKTTLDVIRSTHGHDAFLMEYEQLGNIVSRILQ